MALKYHMHKFDTMERGEKHGAMKKFIRSEEIGEHHFMKDGKPKKLKGY